MLTTQFCSAKYLYYQHKLLRYKSHIFFNPFSSFKKCIFPLCALVSLFKKFRIFRNIEREWIIPWSTITQKKDQNSQNHKLLLILEDSSSISSFFFPRTSDGIFLSPERQRTQTLPLYHFRFGIILYIGQPATLKEAGRSEVQNKQKKMFLCPTGGKSMKLPEYY